MVLPRLLLGITRLRVHCRNTSQPCQATCQLSMRLPHLTAPTRLHQFGLTRRSAPAQRSMKTCSLWTSYVAEEGCITTARRGEQRLGKGHQAARRPPPGGRSLNNSKVFRLLRMHSALMRLPAALLVLQAVRTARLSNAQPDDRAPSAEPLDRQKMSRCTALNNRVRPQRMFSTTSNMWTSAA